MYSTYHSTIQKTSKFSPQRQTALIKGPGHALLGDVSQRPESEAEVSIPKHHRKMGKSWENHRKKNPEYFFQKCLIFFVLI